MVSAWAKWRGLIDSINEVKTIDYQCLQLWIRENLIMFELFDESNM